MKPLLGSSAESVAKKEDPDVAFSLKQIAAEKLAATGAAMEETGRKL